MKHLYLVRGLPGSGKSTLAKLLPFDSHFEADMFFIKDGEYKFDHTKIKEAHAWCQEQTRLALERDETVVVSNTFVKKWEMEPYLKMYPKAVIHTADGSFKNIHGVPDEVILRMKENWEY